MRRIALIIVSAFVLTGCVAGCDIRINSSPPTSPSPVTTPVATVPPPTINTFTADATRLGPPNGQFLDTYLRWDVQGSADTRCRIDSLLQPSQSLGNVPMGGFAQVRPGISRDYALSCTNAGGTAIRVVSIIVG